MDKVNLDDLMKAALVELQEYLDLQIRYNKVLLAKRLGEISSYFTLFLLLLGVTGFIFIFLSFAFVEWFNTIYDDSYYGHLIVAGFYIFLALLLLLFRKQLIFNPIRSLLGGILIGEESNHIEDAVSFKTKEGLNINLKKYKKAIDKKEKKLRERFEKLGDQFTVSNIIQTVAMNAYNSFITTSNIAKAAYNLIKRITGKKKRKVKKKQRDGSPEIEENSY